VVSTAIIIERQEDGHAYPVEWPVYFVSDVLTESKARYQPVQKLLYVVLITSRKLWHYFQQYSITVVTDYPLGDILRNQDATGHYKELFNLRRNHYVADRWKFVAIQCPRRFQIPWLNEHGGLNLPMDLTKHHRLTQSVTFFDRRKTARSPLSPAQSPMLVTKMTVTDSCWHKR
jgi:hypothetical protein